MYCAHCGTPLPDNANFCASCGNRSMSATPPSSPNPAPSADPKSKEALRSRMQATLARKAPPAHPSSPTEEGPVGIGGWLILVVLGLIVAACVQGYGALSSLGLLADLGPISTPGSDVYMPGLPLLITIEMFAQILLAAAAVALLVLCYERRARFPRYYFAYVWTVVGVAVVDNVLLALLQTPLALQADFAAALEEGYGVIVQSLITALIWGTYIRVSKRVKNTFTE